MWWPRIREIIDGQIIPHLERRQARQDCPRLHLRSVTARLDIRAAADDDQAPERVATHPLELALKPFALGPATRHEVVNDLALDGRDARRLKCRNPRLSVSRARCVTA
jgi:hypothetical protein